MTRLVDDLLSLSRVEMREHLTPPSASTSTKPWRMIQSLQPIAGQTGTTIEFRRLEEPAVIRGDSDEIVQMFQNLVQNAVKYGKPGRRIDVAIVREPAGGGHPARFVASVRMTGPASLPSCPASPSVLPRQRGASREKGGTGLGLAIVKHILNRHRGELNVTSRVGHGSTFAVILPTQD